MRKPGAALPFLPMLLVASLSLAAQEKNVTSAKETRERLPGLSIQIMDATADPCVDFFQYACGNFSKYHPIPEDRSGFAVGTMVWQYTQGELRRILETAFAGGTTRTRDEQQIGAYYGSCMDVNIIERKGMGPLVNKLHRIDAVTDAEELADLLGHYQLMGVNAFFNLGEQKDFIDPNKQIAFLDQAGLGLPEADYYSRAGEPAESIRARYVQHIENSLRLAGEPDRQAAIDARVVMELETAIAKLSMDSASRRDPANAYHMMKIPELASLSPFLPWTRLLNGAGIGRVTELNVRNPEFFKGLNTLLSSNSIERIRPYLRWHLLHSIPGSVMPKNFDDEQFSFYGKTLRGRQRQASRWERCVDATEEGLPEVLGKIYVARNFAPSNKQAALKMVHEIEGAMEREIDSLNWMSPATRVRAKEKLHAVAVKIGYPDHWRDYSNLKIASDDAYGNFERAIEFENRRQLGKIGQPLDRDEWEESPDSVDAFYSNAMNDMTFPAGSLQQPLYDSASPDAQNYGHIGSVMGHELIHGFDDVGRQFDGKGKLTDWWTPEDAERFQEKTSCEEQQYSSFTVVDGIKVNGKLTLGENTADSGGLRLAYVAFLADAAKKRIELNRNEDPYTNLQQFFLAYAQNWCGSARPQEQRVQGETDEHSPRQFRVNGVMQNMPDFGNAFHCKVGQSMMPKNRCRVW